jgi:hypothetical protein
MMMFGCDTDEDKDGRGSGFHQGKKRNAMK